MNRETLWHSRGYIPHFDHPNLIQLVTLRLEDAVPKTVIEKWKQELGWAQGLSASDPRQSDLRKKIEKYEDAGYGACRLQNDRVANIVESAILHFDAERYRIIAWCVMPNHVHIIIEILEKFVLSKVIHSWKSYTAHTVNEILHRSGEFWFREYHDRYIRDPEHLARAVEYVENNPVKAKLAAKKEDWKWSSASLKENQYF